MGQLSPWNRLGGTVGLDGQTIDLPGPTVLPTRSAPPFPCTPWAIILIGGVHRKWPISRVDSRFGACQPRFRALPDTFTLMALDRTILQIAASECLACLLTIPLGLDCATKFPIRMSLPSCLRPCEDRSLRNLRPLGSRPDVPLPERFGVGRVRPSGVNRNYVHWRTGQTFSKSRSARSADLIQKYTRPTSPHIMPASSSVST